MLHKNVKGRSEYQANNLANYRLKIKANHYGSITMTASTWVDAFNQRATIELMKARNISEHHIPLALQFIKKHLDIITPSNFLHSWSFNQYTFHETSTVSMPLYGGATMPAVLMLRGLVFSTSQLSSPISGKTRLLSFSQNLTGSFSTVLGLSATFAMPAPSHLSKSYLFFKGYNIIFDCETRNHCRVWLES